MDYVYIEGLVKKAKANDVLAKEALANEFTPLINNISRKTYIDGYDRDDVKNECFRILFKCVKLYKIEHHRFVAYATNGIKNSINDLIRRSKSKKPLEVYETITLSKDLEKLIPDDTINLEEILLNNLERESIKSALLALTNEEKELIEFIFFKNYSMKNYAFLKKLCYSTVALKKRTTLDKLKKHIEA